MIVETLPTLPTSFSKKFVLILGYEKFSYMLVFSV